MRELREYGLRKVDGAHLSTIDVNIMVLTILPGRTVEKVIRDLRKTFPGIVVDLNHTYDLSQGGDGKALPFPNKMIGWGRTPKNCGQGFRIGMIDTAVDKSHPVLKGRVIIQRHFLSKNKKPSGTEHGTAVAAILVGNPLPDGSSGLLPAATLYVANIFERAGKKGKRGTIYGILRAIDWLVSARVHAVNLSIAGLRNSIFGYVIGKGVKKGLVMVTAAGNGGPRAKPAWPAAHSQVTSVTAIDKRLTIYRHANRGTYIDFAAPGVNVPTPSSRGPAYKIGTSFAAPYITALTAMLVAHSRERDIDVLRKKLKRYVIDHGNPGRDPVFGWGMVRARPHC